MDERWDLPRFLDYYQGALATLDQLAGVKDTRLSRYEKEIRRGVDRESHQSCARRLPVVSVRTVIKLS